MENFSWGWVFAALLGSGGAIVTILKVSTYISERIDKRKESKKAADLRLIENAADLEKIRVENKRLDHEAVLEAVWKMIDKKDGQINALEEELENRRNAHSLSQGVITKIYRTVREIRGDLEELDRVIIRKAQETGYEDLLTVRSSIEKMRTKVETLENALP